MSGKTWKHGALCIFVVAILAAVVSLPGVGAQGRGRGGQSEDWKNVPAFLPDHQYDLPGTLITNAQIQAHLAKMREIGRDDVPMNMVKAGGAGGGKHQVGISVIYRLKGQKNPSYAVHDDVTEVYNVIEGKGTMLLGGHLTDAARRPPSGGNGIGSGGTTSDGAKQVTIQKGDILIIPAGTPHRWMDAEEFTAYTCTRIDTDGVAPLLELGKADLTPPKKKE